MAESQPYSQSSTARSSLNRGDNERPDQGLRYAWRSIEVAVMFGWFASACLGLIGQSVLLRFKERDAEQRQRQLRRALSDVSTRWMAYAERRGLARFAVERREGLSTTAGCLIVANHPTIIDVILLWSQFPNLTCVGKSDLRRMPLLAPLIRPLGYLLNHDPEALLEEAAERLRRGETLLVFPEGTRSVTGQPLAFRLGAAEMALRAACDVLPVAIHHDGSYLRKGQSWFDTPRQKVRYGLTIGPRRPIASYQIDLADRRRSRRKLSEQLRADLAKVLA